MKTSGSWVWGFWTVLPLAIWLVGGRIDAATIKVDGKEYENAELIEIGAQGPFYKVGGEVVVLPWAEVDRFEAAAIRQRFAEALLNLRQKAFWVQGTVFEKTEAGVVVHTGSSAEGERGKQEDRKERKGQKEKAATEAVERQMEKGERAAFNNGAEVATGLVVLRDLPRSQYSEGAPVATLAYQVGKLDYELGLGMKKELLVCRIAKPGWVGIRKWRNREGRDMAAELVAVKEGKCLFRRDGKNFVYPLDQLSDDGQKLVADFRKNSREIPLKREP